MSKEDIPEMTGGGEEKKEYKHEQINMVLGTTDGSIMVFDPVLRGKHNFQRYHYGFEKKKTVDIIRWIEKPSDNN